jgi:hypothetical protein
MPHAPPKMRGVLHAPTTFSTKKNNKMVNYVITLDKPSNYQKNQYENTNIPL